MQQIVLEKDLVPYYLNPYYSGRGAGRVGGWLAGLNENKANSANQLELGLG